MSFKEIINSPSFFGFSFTSLVAIFSMIYYIFFIKKENYFYLDNSSNKSIFIKIDQEDLTLLPETFVKLKLTKGIHKILIQEKGKQSIDTFFVVDDINGLINTTFSDYFIYKNIYGYRENKDSIINSQKRLEIDGEFYKGNIEKKSNLFISNFDFGLDESFPKIIHKDSINDRTKIYRKKEFIKVHENLKFK